MTTSDISQVRYNLTFPYFALILAMIVAMGLFVLLVTGTGVTTHADTKHGSEAGLARTCNDSREYMFYNPSTMRTAFVCIVQDGRFGIYVMDQARQEVTAFIKNKMKSIDQVRKYMMNSGYVEIP